MDRVTLDIQGMSCGHCVGAVTRALESVNGVTVEQVRLGTATVSFDPAAADADAIARAVEEAGYEARPAART